MTHGGDVVAVKVQRPEVDRIFAADMRNLSRFASVVDALGIMGTISIKEMLTEFADWTSRELDFTTEGRTADRLRVESLPGGTVPLVYWDLTRRRVLTMEFVEGKSLAQVLDSIERNETDLLKKEYPDLDLPQVAENLSFVILNQLFVTGFFHGDPHPGNIFLRGDNTVVFLDCGIFGELSDSQRENLAAHVENEALGNIDASFRFYAKQLRPTDQTDMRAFEREAKAVLQLWHDNGMSEDAKPEDRHLGKYAGEMLKVVRKHHLRMSTDTLLFWRAMEALDATALRFGEYYDQLRSMRAFFEQARPSPAERVRQIITNPKPWLSLERLYSSVPNSARTIISNLQNQIPLAIQVRESLKVRRGRNRRTKLIVSPIFAVSGALILARLPVGTPLQIALVVLISSFLGITMLQWFRR
jgi:ubiquinone biosynthesis protein